MSSVNRKRRGLGQGLGALIPGTAAPSSPGDEPVATERGRGSAPPNGLRQVPIGSILPNPYQPRTVMEEEQLSELTASIREHGILQPLIVTQMEDGAVGERFRLIAGERRWRAARQAGLTEVPVVVKEATEREMLELAIIENIQRADLNALEEAAAYQQMIELSGMTQERVADRVGKKRSTVTNLLRLLRLPEPVQNLVREGKLSEGHARALASLTVNHPDITATQLMEAAELFIREKFTVRQAEEWVKREPPTARRPAAIPPASLHDRELERQFTSAFGTSVELRRRKKGGHLIIHFESDEDLQSIYDQIQPE